MKAPQRVVWTEGMFMSPHHLQQQDLYHEALLETRVEALMPYGWGVVELEFDVEALRAGEIQLMRFSGILPGGLPVAFEKGQAEAPRSRPVEGHFAPAHKTLDVYLGVPKERSGVESYRVNGQVGGNPRFLPTNRPVADLNASTSLVPVSFAQRNVALLFGTEPRDDYDAIKLAELARDKSGNLVLVETYVPPCLRVSASTFVMGELRTLLRLLVAKQRQLSARRRHRDASALEYTAADVTLFLELNALNASIPFLQHVVDAGTLRPHDLYLHLIQLAGSLCSFVSDVDPAALPAFQFINLRATFEPLFGVIQRLLRWVALEQYLTVEMRPEQGRLYRAKLEDERLDRCGQFLLAVRSVLPEKTVAEQLPKLAKVASASEIDGIVQAAAPGVPLEVTYRPPAEVPVQPGVVYFALSLGDGYWRKAMRERTVALYLPQPFDIDQTSVEMIAVPTATR